MIRLRRLLPCWPKSSTPLLVVAGLSAAFLLPGIFLGVAQGQVPRTLSYQGVLSDSVGNPRPDGPYTFTFRLYDSNVGGSTLWTESRTLTLVNGLFNTVLGDQTPIDASVPFDRQYWLGVQVGVDAEMSPRTPLSSVGYSFRSLKADSAMAVRDRSILSRHIADGQVVRAINGHADRIYLEGSGDTDLWWLNDSTLVIYASGAVPLVIEDTSSDTLVQVRNTGTGTAAYFEAPDFVLEARSASGMAAFFHSDGVNPNFPTLGVRAGPSGAAAGFDGNLQVNGTIYCNQPTGSYAAEFSGPIYTTGNVDVGGVLYVDGPGPGGGLAAFVKGDADVDGDLVVGGTIYNAAQSFRIDHPLEPATKYLQQSSVTSPDMMNVYNGDVVLDANGEAWVDLPDYLDALNRDFRYQLTAIGAPGPNLYVSEKVANHRFRIAGGTPGLEVSWQVTGIRKDPWGEANRLVVETEKAPADQGRYLHPEVYGRPAEMAIGRQQAPARSGSRTAAPSADWKSRLGQIRGRAARPAGGK